MVKAKWHYYIRRAHRYLGVFLGIQFLAWTVGGLYFSWTNINAVTGDTLRKSVPLLTTGFNIVSPSIVLDKMRQTVAVDTVTSIQLINVADSLYYQILYTSKQVNKVQLAHAQTGALRPALNEKEAVDLALSRFKEKVKVKKVEYMTESNGHHEYRKKPLPAFVVHLEHETNTRIYVAAELGIVQNFRNDQWRIYDFLWMLHTMDFQERSNFNNWLIRGVSILGLITLASGFTLFVVSSKRGFKK